MSGAPARILIVDDEPETARAIERMTRHFGHEVAVASSAEEALARFAEDGFDVVVTDVHLGTVDGLALLRSLNERAPDVPVVLITGRASVDSAMEAIHAGAYEYLDKPLRLEALGRVIERAVRQRRLAREAPSAEPAAAPLEHVAGRSPGMLEVFKTVARVAPGRTSVLILGESGTGKELVARALHRLSPRAERSFVPVNVSAIPDGLIESELFGHLRGAFTGAGANRQGLFDEAHEGTLFMDEIGDLSMTLQAKLLRVLQEHRIKPVGANEEHPVDTRLVASTHRDLREMVRAGRFREDLYYRLNVISITLPPLRDRREDIPVLATHFLDKFVRETGRRAPVLTPEALARMEAYDWPGNVRELENVLQRAALLSSHGQIGLDALPEHIAGAVAERRPGARASFPALHAVVEDYVRQVLEHTQGNRTAAARILGISRRTLHRMEERRRAGEDPEDRDDLTRRGSS
jgi:DNA-binding NtrC family response regulator